MTLPETSSVPLRAPSRLPSRRKVFALPAGFSGCAWWRYRLPLAKLNKLGADFDIDIADNADKRVRMEDVQRHVNSADLISLQAPGHRDAYTLMRFYRSEAKKVIVDYDDFSFDLDPGNFRYQELGTKECELLRPDGSVIYRWRDGENGFDLKSNIAKFEAFNTCVRDADCVTTTTKYLAAKFLPLNPNVAVCPNSIDFDIWKPIARPDRLKNELRIGWFGGDSHFIDLGLFKGLLPRICRSYPHVKIVMQAPPVPEWREFFQGIPEQQLEWHFWAELRYYPLFAASRHWDIGLCPLADNEFNRCKSSIKQFEFSALGAAVIAQNMTPYAETIKHNETGFLAGDEREWFDYISTLIENEGTRKRLADNGRQYVFDNFNLDRNCRLWEKTFSDTLEGRRVGQT